MRSDSRPCKQDSAAAVLEIRAMMSVMGTDAGARPEQSGKAVFFRFTDQSGRVHIVDSLDLVPQAARGAAERVRYGEETAQNRLPTVPNLAGWQIFALGMGTALLIGLLFRRLPGLLGTLIRVAIVAGVLVLASGAYFGFIRQTTQQSGGGAALATPGALIDDAKSAVDKMNAGMRAQQAELKEIEQAK
jgi:hypothetical protein